MLLFPASPRDPIDAGRVGAANAAVHLGGIRPAATELFQCRHANRDVVSILLSYITFEASHTNERIDTGRLRRFNFEILLHLNPVWCYMRYKLAVVGLIVSIGLRRLLEHC